MIDYQYLCQAIDDWRAGRRPGAPPPAGVPEQGYSSGGTDPAGVPIQEVGDGDIVEMSDEGPQYEEVGDAAGFEQENYDTTHAYGAGAESESGAQEQYDTTQAYVPDAPPSDDVEEVDIEEMEADDDDDEDWERDYDLEAVDDAASFDLMGDLKGYFVAELRIEQAWEDKASRQALLGEYGIRNEQHFYQVKATVERYIQSADAQERYGDVGDILQLKGNASMDMQHQQMQQRAEGELASEFEPVEGVALDQWAVLQAQVAGGGDVDEIIAGAGLDREVWDRVSAEWNARMSRDTTATIATAYGKAFSGAGVGQFGGAGQAGADAMTAGGDVDGEPPIPLERYVEIEVAQACGVEQGKDAAEILQSFGLSIMDWSNLSAWFSQYFARHMNENDQALYHRYTELQQEFEAKYKAGGADEDIDY